MSNNCSNNNQDQDQDDEPIARSLKWTGGEMLGWLKETNNVKIITDSFIYISSTEEIPNWYATAIEELLHRHGEAIESIICSPLHIRATFKEQPDLPKSIKNHTIDTRDNKNSAQIKLRLKSIDPWEEPKAKWKINTIECRLNFDLL